MKNTLCIPLLILHLVITPAYSQKGEKPTLFSRQNLVAWCVIPFDKMKRTPEQRADMLKDLGISQLAYDWREEHLPSMEEEIQTLRKNNINLKSVWFWVDGGSGQILDESNNFILKTLNDNNVKTELWVSFNDSFFEGISNEEKLKKAVSAVSHIRDRAKEIGCTVHLYNHGSWFGEPQNQISIIKALGVKDVGMVYNFHHGHKQQQDFPKLLALMKPYLSTVNLNGMKAGGPQILPIGQGDQELAMMQQLKNSGFNGTLGILSHVEDEDAKIVLSRNLEGLKSLLQKMKEEKALKTY